MTKLPSRRLGFFLLPPPVVFSVLLVSFIMAGLILWSGNTAWHEEKYVAEGGGYFLIMQRGTPPTRHYYVGKDEVKVGLYPQTYSRNKDWFHFSSRRTGPYRLSVLVGEGKRGDGKRVIIHKVTFTNSTLGTTHDFPGDEPLPVELPATPKYHNPTLEYRDITNYHHLFQHLVHLDFNNREEVLLMLDVEVKNDHGGIRETVTIKLLPLLDEGSVWLGPGYGV